MGIGAVGVGSGIAHGLSGLGGGEERSDVNLRDRAAGKKGYGDVGGGNMSGEFGNGEDREGAQSKETGLDGAAETLDGDAHGLETILGILQDTGPGFGGVTGLDAVARHKGVAFRKEERAFRNMRRWGCGVKTESTVHWSINGI